MTESEKLIMQMKLLRAEMKSLYHAVQASKAMARFRGEAEPRLDWTENAKTCMMLDDALTQAGVSLWDDMPLGSEMVAHDTGDGWYLALRDKETQEEIRELPWLDGWPESLPPQFLRNLGFQIV